jgi:RNA polymerase sigma factor (TIGR02999 family)
VPAPRSAPVRQTLDDVREGRQPASALLPLLYADLKRLAAVQLRALPPGHTLQPTALVHEAWIKLVGSEDPGWEGRRHFFGAAARAMRELIVDDLRRKGSAKRRAPGQRTVVDSSLAPAAVLPELHDVLAVDAAITQLEAESPEAAEVVVLSFFGGLTFEEIAAMMDLSTRTIERKWQFARAWLLDALSPP